MFYYLYKITNLLSGKIYIGVHKTKNLEDGYMGSGKVINNAIKKYGIDNFQKEILEFFNTPEEMYSREKEYVTDDFLLREDVYNLRRGGKGGFDFINSKEDQTWRVNAAKKTTKIFNEKFSGDENYRVAYSKKRTEIAKQLINDPTNNFGKNNPSFAGRKHSEETIQKMIDAKKGKGTKENNSQFGTCWITNETENKKIKRDDIRDWISVGWRPGRKM